jgi:hypothetical protein
MLYFEVLARIDFNITVNYGQGGGGVEKWEQILPSYIFFWS